MVITIGIIGIGRWGMNCFRTLSEMQGVEIKWICARSSQTIQTALVTINPKLQPKATLFHTTRYTDILKDTEVEAVLIATPAKTHATLTKAALLAGKDVFVEKPFTLSLKEAGELVALAQQRKRILMVGHIHCFNSAIAMLRDDLSAGKLGALSAIESVQLHNDLLRKDAGALWDILPHALTILQEIVADSPLSVRATGDQNEVHLSLQYPTFTATCRASWYATEKTFRIIVKGKKEAVFDDYAAEKLQYNGVPQHFSKTHPLTAELQHFLDCIRTRTEPKTSGQSALLIMKILSAAEYSITSGTTVQL